MKLLFAKNFVIAFEDGVCVIKHWRIHNYIRADRKKDTAYIEHLSKLEKKENGSYTLKKTEFSQMSGGWQADGRQLGDTGKVSLVQDSLSKNNTLKSLII